MKDLASAARGELLDFITELQGRIRQLESQVRFLGNHPTLARGMAGEQLAVASLMGKLTAHTAPNDIVLATGQTIEVKTSYLPYRRGAEARRWAWEKIFGENNNKMFNYLLLVGESDIDHMSSYLEPEASFVLFLVSFNEVMSLTTAGVSGARKIQLNTNPDASRKTPAQALFKQYAVTAAEIARRTTRA